VSIIEHADIKRMLLFQRAIVERSLSLLLQCCKFADLEKVTTGDEKEIIGLLMDILTPIAKSYPSEMGILSVSNGLQCFGGYGYCDVFPLEQYYRDIRIHPIHEGTTGIQGIDLLGRKVIMHNGKAFTLFIEEVKKTIDNTRNYKRSPMGDNSRVHYITLHQVTTHLSVIAQKNEKYSWLMRPFILNFWDYYNCLAMAPSINCHPKNFKK